MEFSGKSATCSIACLLAVLAAAFFAASLSGCASPGPARPPSLHLPRLVNDLSAMRTGDDVMLRWTTSDKTTDGLKVQPPLTAEICRALDARRATCTPVKRLAIHPGISEASDALPPALTADAPTLLTYRVQILNANGHSAGLSAPAFAAAGAAPPPVEDLKATPVHNGAMLEWQPESKPSAVDLDRILVQTAAPKKPSVKKPLQLTSSVPTEIHLKAGEQSIDPGGTIDGTAQRGETYRYTAQRVQSVTLRGHALEIRSSPSAAITVLMRDTFPPHAPTGLAAIASGPDSAHRSIDLSWEPNTEPDLVGYIVYRQPVASDSSTTGAATLLTPTPIAAPSFSDFTAIPGQTYSYRVVAVDIAGNQSPASAEARESLRNP